MACKMLSKKIIRKHNMQNDTLGVGKECFITLGENEAEHPSMIFMILFFPLPAGDLWGPLVLCVSLAL